jgi:hypothetical protein
MDRIYTPPVELEPVLRNSYRAFLDLIRFIRVNYCVDEIWNGKDELKIKLSSKTLTTICIKDGFFNVLMIFGKAEREQFNSTRDSFSQYIRNYYDNSRTYHDGKWMFIDINDHTYLDDMYHLLKIKKKPNRKTEDLSKADIGCCGNRCDLCLLNIRNNADKGGSREFHQLDWICNHSEGEERVDYTNVTCAGCRSKPLDACPVKICLTQKEYQSCSSCNFQECFTNLLNIDPAKCNLGLSADDITKAVMPYYAKWRLSNLTK